MTQNPTLGKGIYVIHAINFASFHLEKPLLPSLLEH